MKLSVLILLISSAAFANMADTVCTIDGHDVTFDIGTGSPPDNGSRIFYALEIGKIGEKADKEILSSSIDYDSYYKDYQGGFSLAITTKKKHRLVFSAIQTTAANKTVKTTAFSRIKGFRFSQSTFTCQ